MSSLWTPGGEVPIEPERPRSDQPDPDPVPDPGSDPGGQADYDQMRRQMLELPASDVIAQHAVALYELAALHLSESEPRLPDARLAIDALTALVEGLSGRLGPAEQALAEALPQLKMAYVEAADR